MSITIEQAREILGEKIEMLDGAAKVARRNGNEAEVALLERKLTIHYGVQRGLAKGTMKIADLPAAMFTPWQPGQHASASMQPHHRELLDRILREHPTYSKRLDTRADPDAAPVLRLAEPPSKPAPATNWREQARADWDANKDDCHGTFKSWYAFEGYRRTKAQAKPVTPPDDALATMTDDADDAIHDAILADWEKNAGNCQKTFKNLYAYSSFRRSLNR